MLEIVPLTLGPAVTNAYLVADSDTKEAAVIDPAWDGPIILEAARQHGWRIAHLWYTHAHFDHIGGAGAIADALNPLPLVALHPNDHVLWRAGGGGAFFGFDIDPGPEPTIDFFHGQILRLGNIEFEVRFTPGHTPGHCILYVADIRAATLAPDARLPDLLSKSRAVPGSAGESPQGERSDPERVEGERSRSAGICFCGDLIFASSVGRTDLPGGDWEQLVESIKTQIYTLPDDTRLLSGHGPATTVGEEKKNNPFVSG